MAYELFHRKEGRLGKGAYLTITKQGTMRLSHSCHEKYFEGFESVFFLYDKEEDCIALKPSKKKNADTYKIRKTKTTTSVIYSISAVSFLKYHGIDFSKIKKFEPIWNEDSDLLEIDLKQPL